MNPKNTNPPVADAAFIKDADRIHFAANAAGLGIWEVDVATNTVLWDNKCCEFFGISGGNIIPYEQATRYIHPDDVEEVNQKVAAALRGENNGLYDATYRTIGADDGLLRWVNFSGTAYFDVSGSITRFGGIAQDITNRFLQQQQDVEEQEARFRSVVEESTVATALYTGKDIHISYVNDAMLGYWGKDRSVLGKPLRTALPELEDQPFPDLLDRVFATGVAYQSSEAEAFLMVDGELKRGFYNFTYKPLFDTHGKVWGILHMAVDVTQQVLDRQKLAESEERFRSIVKKAPVAVFVFRGPDMVIDIANEKALEMIGCSEDVVGKPLVDAVPELKGTSAYQTFQDVYRTGIAQHGREVLVPLNRGKNPEDRWFNFAYTPIYENGVVTGIMDVASEVTDQVIARKQIEEMVANRTKALAETNGLLEASIKELQRSNANLEEFAHAASHDLKEPIRKISFFTELLKTQLEPHLDEAGLRSFTRIENAAQRMGALIDDLLLYSHVSHRPHETESVDLNIKVQRVLEDLEVDIEEKKAAVAIGKLPVVQGYSRQLQQMFQNLISNALKYSREDVLPMINISATKATEEGRQYHVVTVSDNGIGFDEQYAEKIFQMFARLHGRSEYSGTGVGLSIVKKVAENHHGFVRVKSLPDKGSSFSIYLPA